MVRSKRTTIWNRVCRSVRKVIGFIREENVATTKRIIGFPHFQRVRIAPAAEHSGSTARFRSATAGFPLSLIELLEDKTGFPKLTPQRRVWLSLAILTAGALRCRGLSIILWRWLRNGSVIRHRADLLCQTGLLTFEDG